MYWGPPSTAPTGPRSSPIGNSARSAVDDEPSGPRLEGGPQRAAAVGEPQRPAVQRDGARAERALQRRDGGLEEVAARALAVHGEPPAALGLGGTDRFAGADLRARAPAREGDQAHPPG